jgi:hypothetical protein
MSLLDSASLCVTPNAYNVSKLYSVVPNTTLGDMDVVRATTATRVNSAGLIESVAINVPRLDYTGGSCPSILVEPARTNLVLYSEQFDNASWTKVNTSATANTTSAPDGTVTADTITGIGALGLRLVQTNTIAFTASTSYSLSVFAKKGTNDFIQLFVPLGIGGMFANFNINTGVVGTLGTVTGTTPTSSITNFGGGWYRCTINFTANATTGNVASIGIVTSASATRAETNTLTTSVILWGAQVEAGANATSYIPTVASQLQRNADVISKTGISSLIGQTEGTIFWDIKDLIGTTNTGNPDFGIKNSAATHWVSLTTSGVSVPFRVTVNSAAGQLLTYSVNITSAKACVKYGTFGAKLFLNGNPTPVATTPTNPNISFDQIQFKGSTISYKTNSFALWKTALTDAQCISLTTP